jgi:uncharacterized protein YdeI (YjbR/CyaY-like superfamily)
MKKAGLEAFKQRREAKSKIYAYEQADQAMLDPKEEAQFRSDKQAWKFFAAQPPRYRHLVVWRIVSARRPETRSSRLTKLIEASGDGQRL